jgi:porphobilinogen synthase
MCRALRPSRTPSPEIGLIADVALDEYSANGQDGLVRDGEILNDETVEVMVKSALVQTAAGADIIAPSDMMDGRVAAIRAALDGARATSRRRSCRTRPSSPRPSTARSATRWAPGSG